MSLDAASDTLTLQAPPNDGTLADVGALGIDRAQVIHEAASGARAR